MNALRVFRIGLTSCTMRSPCLEVWRVHRWGARAHQAVCMRMPSSLLPRRAASWSDGITPGDRAWPPRTPKEAVLARLTGHGGAGSASPGTATREGDSRGGRDNDTTRRAAHPAYSGGGAGGRASRPARPVAPGGGGGDRLPPYSQNTQTASFSVPEGRPKHTFFLSTVPPPHHQLDTALTIKRPVSSRISLQRSPTVSSRRSTSSAGIAWGGWI
jgi:hypothetical protein